MDNIVYELDTSIKAQLKVDGKNEFSEINSIHLKAPSYKERDTTLRLKKKYLEAMFAMTSTVSREDAQKTINEEGEGELNAQSIKAILFAAKDFDIVAFYDLFINLLVRVAYKDEDMSQSFAKLDFEKLEENDLEGLIAKYIEVFFITSWMKTLS